ncbi:hypothetical protein BGI41_07240 [Methanobrevibacter sp. 87.7]|nr:hypothetical protein BGI41_07240 [Methanobrevibacter sp. 87.7]
MVLLSPELLFDEKSKDGGYAGIITLIFFSIFLGLISGILSKSFVVFIVVAIFLIIFTIVFNIVQTIFIYIFSRLLGGEGSFKSTFNLLGYLSVIDIFTLIGLSLTSIGNLIIIPISMLVLLWKAVLVVILVNSEFKIGLGKSFLSSFGILALILICLMGVL